MKLLLQIEWYNLDDSLEPGDECELVPAGEGIYRSIFSGRDRGTNERIRVRIDAIANPTLGAMRRLDCSESFHYYFHLASGDVVCVNAEEEPGAIFDPTSETWRGNWQGRYLVDAVLELEVTLLDSCTKPDAMPAEPLFSILTPCYNARRYLPATYESLRNQTVSEWEWIVADDGSTDGSAEYIEELAATDPRVRLLRCPRAGRPAPGRNAALRVARGEFVALLDADDLFEPGKLAGQIQVLRANPDAMTYHEMESFWSEETGQTGTPPNGWQREPLDEARFADLLLRGNFVPTSSIALPRALVTPESFMDEAPELRGMEDYDFVLRFSRTHRIVRVTGVLGRYRVHDSSLWSSANRSPRERLAKSDAVKRMMESKGHLESPEGRRWLAKHHLLRGEALLRLGDGGCRRDFALTVRCDPANARRWLGLVTWVLPLSISRRIYFFFRQMATGIPGDR